MLSWIKRVAILIAITTLVVVKDPLAVRVVVSMRELEIRRMVVFAGGDPAIKLRLPGQHRTGLLPRR